MVADGRAMGYDGSMANETNAPSASGYPQSKEAVAFATAKYLLETVGRMKTDDEKLVLFGKYFSYGLSLGFGIVPEKALQTAGLAKQ